MPQAIETDGKTKKPDAGLKPRMTRARISAKLNIR
jgi:hypothetical protein